MTTGLFDGEAARRTPAFDVRVSERALRVRLVMTPAGDLVVVVPRRFDQRKIPGIVQAKLPWIERARARMEARRAAAAAAAAEEPSLPERIVLAAIGEVWAVEYREPRRTGGAAGAGRAVAREASPGRLLVTVPSGDEEAARRALVDWLRRRAKKVLPARLAELARVHKLPFAGVTVRHQRSRWGSCSPRHSISLNLRLLFLDPELLDHVLLHELCHTRHLNHSARFWGLLGAHDPDWKTHRRRTREAWRTLPRWLRDGDGRPEL
jgi:predicted metal-dependent hydrolase